MDLRAVAPRTSSHPVDVGQRTEGAILSELVRRGYDVLVPFGTNQRYDLVLDLDGELVRVQCKTGRLRDGTVRFSTQSIQSNTRRTVMRGYLGDADLFLVYCPEIGKVYVVPVEEVGVSKTYLRVDPVRNGQSHGVRWAEDYELPG